MEQKIYMKNFENTNIYPTKKQNIFKNNNNNYFNKNQKQISIEESEVNMQKENINSNQFTFNNINYNDIYQKKNILNNENDVNINEYKGQRNTFFDYNQNLEKQMEETFQISKKKTEKKILANPKNESNSIYIEQIKQKNFAQKEYTINSFNEGNKEQEKMLKDSTPNKKTDNKMVKKDGDYYFNYLTQDSFNKINSADINQISNESLPKYYNYNGPEYVNNINNLNKFESKMNITCEDKTKCIFHTNIKKSHGRRELEEGQYPYTTERFDKKSKTQSFFGYQGKTVQKNDNDKIQNSNEIENRSNYYIEYLKKIQDRNDMINKNNYENINKSINDLYNSKNVGKNYNKNDIYKKSFSVDQKIVKQHKRRNSFNSKTNQKKNCNKINNFVGDSLNKKVKNKSINKININSYFQIKERANKNNYYNSYVSRNSNDQSLSSFTEETKDNDFNKIDNFKNPNKGVKNYPVSMTPNGYYRNEKYNINNYNNLNSLTNANEENKSNDYISNTRDDIMKNIGKNYRTMSQKKYYRNKNFLERPIYEDNFQDKIRTMRELSSNSNINNTNDNPKFFHSFRENHSINLTKRINNHSEYPKYSQYNNNYNSKNMMMNENNLGFSTISNMNYPEKNKVNYYRCKCNLRKGKSYNNIIESNNVKEKNNLKLNENNVNNNILMNILSKNNNINGQMKNICYDCLKKRIYEGNNFNNFRLCDSCQKLLIGKMV